jgi:hypothetical protein
VFITLGDGTSVHLNIPRCEKVEGIRRRCTTCEKRTRQVARFYGYYGWNVVCCRCGERYSEEGRYPRPFERGWRQRNIEEAERIWKALRTPSEEKP